MRHPHIGLISRTCSYGGIFQCNAINHKQAVSVVLCTNMFAFDLIEKINSSVEETRTRSGTPFARDCKFINLWSMVGNNIMNCDL